MGEGKGAEKDAGGRYEVVFGATLGPITANTANNDSEITSNIAVAPRPPSPQDLTRSAHFAIAKATTWAAVTGIMRNIHGAELWREVERSEAEAETFFEAQREFKEKLKDFDEVIAESKRGRAGG